MGMLPPRRTRRAAAWKAGVCAGVCAVAAGCGWADDSTVGPGGLQITVQSAAYPTAGQTVELSATLDDPTLVPSAFLWEVAAPSEDTVELTLGGDRGEHVSFVPALAGQYSITCRALRATETLATSSLTLAVEDPAVLKLPYTLRVVPPPGLGLAPYDSVVEVGTVEQDGQLVLLPEPRRVQVVVQSAADRQPLSSTLRLFRLGGDPQPRDVQLPTGAGALAVSGLFHALVLPDGNAVAPDLLVNQDAARLPSSLELSLTPGQPVSGMVLGHAGAPLPETVVRLHVDAPAAGLRIPSTVGRSAANGAFSLLSREGHAELLLAAPAATGLPLVLVRDPALQVQGACAGWTFTFSEAAPVQLSGVVRRSTGELAAAGTTVLLVAEVSGAAGTLALASGATFQGQGIVRRELVTDSDGRLTDPITGAQAIPLPPANYEVQVRPGPHEPGTQGTAFASLDLRGSVSDVELQLASRVTFAGTVRDVAESSVEAAVVVRGAGGTYRTRTDTGGAFELQVDAGSGYDLAVRPRGRQLGTYLASGLAITNDTTLQITVPDAVQLRGRVTTTGAFAVPGALIQVWCSGLDCDSEAVVDETHTAADGSFTVRVPPSEKRR